MCRVAPRSCSPERGPAAARGMTLIELMVVFAIIAIMIVVGAVSINAIRGADVDATGSILSGAMTYVSARAVHDNRTYRLVIDMDQRRFWTESTDEDDPCARYLPEEAEPPSEAGAARKEDEAAAEGEAAAGGGFTEQKIDLLHRDFEAGTNVTAVLTSHHTQPQSGGKVAIYFYPNGQAERALVWVGAKGGEEGWEPEITVELHSLGRVTWHPDPVDERDFDLRTAEEVR